MTRNESVALPSTMQDYPITVAMLFDHGRRIYGDSEVVTAEGGGTYRRASFAEVAERADRLAAGLRGLGVGLGDRVGTFCWNHQEHLEAYLAVPSMGAVLHMLNIRLFPEQVVYVANHAEDRVVIVDASLVPVLAPLAEQLNTVEHFVVIGNGDMGGLPNVLTYDELLDAGAPGFTWPAIEERSGAGMCYTTGTTGNPKGVVYSHRSTFLHSLGICTVEALGLNQRDRVLPIVPMFHANAWGLPYAAWTSGADLVLPDRFLQGPALAALIEEERPTVAAGVPTVFNDLLHYAEDSPVDFSSIRLALCGGSAVPRALMERYIERHGVRFVQGWGMTESSPLAAVSNPPRGTADHEELDWRAKSGRVVSGVELRLVDDEGAVQPWDGYSVGEIELRGPWITGSYYRQDDDSVFDDGWLRTGDVGTVDEKGYVQLTDRAKDIIKSGGEWISSVELEVALMAHEAVREAAVIGVPDERWQERPLACVVLNEGMVASPEELREFLIGRVAKWWLPERFVFLLEIPKTSVGKFDKKALRAREAEGVRAVDHGTP